MRIAALPMLVGALVLGFVSPLIAEGVAPVSIEFLLDVSESMSEAVLGGAKIDLARRALLDVLDTFPSSYNIGLRVFGHRYAPSSVDESCSDSQLLCPMAPLTSESRASLEQHMAALVPKGMSPISWALESVANDFFGLDGRKVLVLLSDGEETCGRDPESVAAYITQLVPDLELCVVGFDVSSLQQLEDIAAAGDGTYHHARNGIEIANALSQAIWDATGVLFFDDFQSELLPAWAVESIKGMTLGVNDHAMTYAGSRLSCVLIGAYVGDRAWTDYSLSMDILYPSGADRNCDQLVIPFRIQDSNHMMAFFLRPRGDSGFRIMSNGIWSGLFGGAETPWADNYSFSMLVQGDTYTVMLNNEPFTTWQGQGYASGSVGIMIGYDDGAPWVDNYAVRQVK